MIASVLAIDVGTSMVKAVLLRSGGEVAGEASRPVVRDGRPGVDTAELWKVVSRTIADVLAEVVGVDFPDAVIITGQGDGLWLVGADGSPLERAYPWNSSEAADVVADWEAEGLIDEHFRSSGTVLWSGAQAALWTWWREAHPELAHSVRAAMCAKDLIGYLLTGEIRTDVTDATIPFLNPVTKTYEDEAFSRLGCHGLTDLVAPIGQPGDLLGDVTADASEKTGLPVGTPVYLGAIDVVAMLWGQGLGAEGDVLAILGTTALSASVTTVLDFSGDPAGATLCLPNGQYLRAMGSSAGAATLEWFMSTMGYSGDARYEAMWAEVEAATPGGEIFLPYLSGERAPILAPFATGTFQGLTPGTTRGSMARAVTEGIAMAMCRGIDHVVGEQGARGEIVLTGGGSQATPWAQQVANITDKEVVIDQRAHVGALGAAGLLIDVQNDAVSRTTVEPNRDAPALRSRYSDFIDLTNTLTPWWATRHGPQ
jgi:sugar (pentulose or hexulose) kinase